MARFLAVVLGALIGVGVVWFFVVKPRQATQSGASPAQVTAADSSPPTGSGSKPLTEAQVAEAIVALTSDEDVVRGSAIEQWGEKIQAPDGKSTIERIALQPALMAALREKLKTMPDDRLMVYADAWGSTDWWVENFAQAHGRYSAWRAGADDTVWVPYAYDQLDRFDPKNDADSIRAIIDVLIKSKTPKVRGRVLECTAHYFGQGSRPYALAHLNDPDNAVARLAWLITAKTGEVDTTTFDWATGPRYVGEAVLYAMAMHNPEQLNATCEFIETDPVIAKWYEAVIPFMRDKATGREDQDVIVTLNEGQGPARIFEEAIRVDALLSGDHPEYVQE